MGRLSYKNLTIVFFLFGITLRVMLFWVNPIDNSFDDYYEPILMIMDSGIIPAKNDCWECYHPPVFYLISATIGNMALSGGLEFQKILKLLQFMPCLYGITTIGIIYLTLQKLPLSDFSKLIAFGTVCFLPRHIYMSAMNSNDTISYLFVALTIYFIIIAIERKLSPSILIILSIVTSITLFTKYTSYVVLPIILVVFFMLFYNRQIASAKKILASFVFVIFIPITLLSISFMSNIKNYNNPIPDNITLRSFELTQPHDQDSFDFISFKPWESINTPILVPGKMHSFWTMIYSGMWYDNEPRFLYFLDSNSDWWSRYYGWLSGNENFPGNNPSMHTMTKSIGAGLITLGLFPLLLIIIGIFTCIKGRWKIGVGDEATNLEKISIFPTLLVVNAAGIIAHVLQFPFYGSAKASYLLNSLPAFAVFLSFGVMAFENSTRLKKIILIVFGLLFSLTGFHILQIVNSLS